MNVNEKDAISFFASIKNPKLKSGLEIKVRETKIINQLKEDKQPSALLVGKEMSPKEIHSYPLISLPLTFSDHSGKLQQSQKALFRNYLYLIRESKATANKAPINPDWMYDGMASVRALPIKPNWKGLALTFLEALTPQEYLHPPSLQIILDTYDDNRIKEMTQRSWGTSN